MSCLWGSFLWLCSACAVLCRSKPPLVKESEKKAFWLPRLNGSEQGGITLLLVGDKSSFTSWLLLLKIQQKAFFRPPTPPPLPAPLPPLPAALVRQRSCVITADTLHEVCSVHGFGAVPKCAMSVCGELVMRRFRGEFSCCHVFCLLVRFRACSGLY